MQSSTADDSQRPPTSKNGLQIVPLLQWAGIAAVGLTVLSLAGVYAPARIKLIGLFAVAYGMIAGCGLRFLRQQVNPHVGRCIVCLSFLLIASGQVGMAFEAYRIQAAQILSDFEDRPDASVIELARFLDEKNLPDDPDERARFQEMQQTIAEDAHKRRRQLAEETSFSGYLNRRLSAMGSWKPSWPTLFWVLEVLAGSAVGAWIVSRRSNTSRTTQPPGIDEALADR